MTLKADAKVVLFRGLSKFFFEKLCNVGKKLYLCTRKKDNGALAQLVEHRTENPCVPGSIPGGTT